MGKYRFVVNWLQVRNISLSRKEIKTILAYTKHKVYDSLKHLMEQDEFTTKLYFLNTGIVRLYRTYDDHDYTLGIISRNDFLSTPLYILGSEKSPCALEALTAIEVLEWSKEDIIAIKNALPNMYRIELAIMERVFAWVQLIQIETICLSAEDRYKKILEEQPEVLLNIPLKYVASFLGIHTDSLSRIRKKFI